MVECVIRALHLFQHAATTQRISLKVLYVILASEVEAILYAAGNAGAVRLAVRVLRSFPENARVIDHAFGVLGHLVKLQQCCEEALSRNALVLSIAALRRCKDSNVQGGVCICLSRLCESDDAMAADALSMGAMELALAALRTYRSTEFSCIGASLLLYVLCRDDVRAVKAKQLGAPALLQAALKAHLSADIVQRRVSAALARIKHFVDAASARAEANMAELIAGEEAAKAGKGVAVAAKKASKGKGKSGEGTAGQFPLLSLPPPVAADGEPTLTKAQIKRRKAKAAVAARKAAAASGSASGEEESEEGSDASLGDTEPPRSRPPLDFSKDSEFRRSLKLPPRDVEAEIDEIIAQHEALFLQKRDTQTGAAPSRVSGMADEKSTPALSEPPSHEAGGEEAEQVERFAFASPPLPQLPADALLAACVPSPPAVPPPTSAEGEGSTTDFEGLRAENLRLQSRVASLEAEVSRLQGELAALRAETAIRTS